MNNQFTLKNAVAAIRVSTTKQGTDGDSPEAQKEQADRYAENKGITIKKYFTFLESASKEQQPMQEAIDYCKDPKNKIDLFIIKSIDRFTRGGSDFYGPLKKQLEQCNVDLVDIYGVISTQKVNTLDHLGFQYRWSIYSPSKKSEILEAERAQDELRDIMSRIIGAEIRYTQLGYYMRQAPYGLKSEKIETTHGKRCILVPEPSEAPYITKMFELRERGTLSDQQIVDEVNKMGYRTRKYYVRDKHDRTRIIDQKGGKPLNVKTLWRYIQNPIYAGVIREKWTNNKPVKAKFNGLISVETFNNANRGKMVIGEDENGSVTLFVRRPAEHLLKKGVRNPEFPFKKVVMCPFCSRPLRGSASRGGSGKLYPAYHCNKRGHHFRKSKQDFDLAVEKFVKNIEVTPEYIQTLFSAVETEFAKRQAQAQTDVQSIDSKITELQTQVRLTVDKMKLLSSETAIKYMEEDIVKLEQRIVELTNTKAKTSETKPAKLQKAVAFAKYYMAHLDYLLLQQSNPVAKANFFGILFNQVPTFQEIEYGTENMAQVTGLNELFRLKLPVQGNVVHFPVMNWNGLKSELIRWHETFKVSPLPSLV